MIRPRSTVGRVVLVWALGLVVLVLVGFAAVFFTTSQWDLALVNFFFVVSVATIWSAVMGSVGLRRLRDSRRRRGGEF